MPSVIQVVIEAEDRTGAAFASAQANARGFALATTGAQTGVAQLGQATAVASAQAGTGLARLEQRADGAEAAIITLGIAGSTTATRMRSLNVSIVNQEQALVLAARRLTEARAAHDADSLAVARSQLAYDRLNRSLDNNRARMRDLRSSGDVTGISVTGAGVTAAPPAAGGATGVIGGLGGAAASLGVALGAREVVQLGVGAISASNSLQDTQMTLRGLTGTTERYTEAVAAARSNQRLFGGSLEQNLQGMQGLATAARGAGIGIDTLNKTTQLLSFKSPEQGALGAMIALNEVLTGEGAESTRSLQMRYELPEKALRAIAAAPDPTAKMEALNQVLADQGITAAVLNDRLGETSQAYRDLGIAADNAQTKVGGILAGALEGPTIQLAGLLKLATGDVKSGMADLYRGGAMASGSSREEAEGRVPRRFRSRDEAPLARVPVSSTGAQSATIAPPQATRGPQSVTNVTVNVAGSVTSERDLSEAVRRRLIGVSRQNGINPVAP